METRTTKIIIEKKKKNSYVLMKRSLESLI